MKLSFRLLMASAAIIVLNQLIGVFGFPSYMLPHQISRYVAFVVSATFYGSLVAFCGYLYLQASSGGILLQGGQPVPREQLQGTPPQTIAGIAVASLVTIVFVMAMVFRGGDTAQSALIFFGFVVACGLLIETPPGVSIWKVMTYAVWPAATFFIACSVFLLLAFLLQSGSVVSGGGRAIRSLRDVYGYVALYAILAAVAVPAIMAACLGRAKLISLVVATTDLEPERLERLKKNVSLLLAIIGIIVGAILGRDLTVNQ